MSENASGDAKRPNASGRSTRDVLAELFALIEERKRLRPEKSYVTSLFDGGHEAIAAKVREEAAELIEAAAADDRGHTAQEAADLVFHTLVLLAQAGVSLDEVLDELASRSGVSGLEEKAARSRDAGDR